MSEKNKKKLEKSKPKFSKAVGFAALSTKSTPYLDDGCSIKNDIIVNSNEEEKLCTDKKLAKSGKFSAKDKGTTGIVRHKLLTPKPLFSKSISVDNSFSGLLVFQLQSPQSPINFVHLQYYPSHTQIYTTYIMILKLNNHYWSQCLLIF